ncbi:MAG: lipopolysaccharide assembly protein LapB [Gammaproteobacteria bacterium]|nr:lipopolysaccharide assembly protein LapB [Gammaproteobacteria bacterium]MCH9763387.1 lipopolysaccharide assembly protein LapB [Gammaproteobacteria bacterium]
MIHLWPMLLPAAACSGWWIARRNYAVKQPDEGNHLSREYVVGLNYLLNEQPDKAVDIFIKLLEVDSETVETHLALGSLFRRRGEVDRAIRIHQNLIARPQLRVMQRKAALMALAEDYMSAGVFDRAERIFIEVVELGGTPDASSLRGLLAIYQQEKSWEKALDVLKKLELVTGNSMAAQAAHYHCEMAEKSSLNGAEDKAYSMLKQALLIDKQSVRASLMLANIEMKHARYKPAIRALKRVLAQDSAFFTETIEPLVKAYTELNSMDECASYLENTLADDHPHASVIFAIGTHLREEKSVDVAIDFVSVQLSHHPSIRGLNQLIQWHLESAHGILRDKLTMLYAITSKFLDNKPIYRCGHCGFSGKLLHWLCPSCKKWGKIKPIHGLEGD